MRALIQRVLESEVKIEDKSVGKIEKGFLVLLGITHTDTEKEVEWLANKIKGLRIFEDENGKMNLGLDEISGDILIVSQFTLYGNCIKGKRPGFTEAARPDIAIPLYESFIEKFKKFNIGKVETGKFGADMKISLINDGPVTLMIDTRNINSI
ncbi:MULTISPECIES: D-aminoacyl-tRNA deacylase [Fusobacterium]|uniref:D-aminoacyl-tRNA deacylase n=1 Tax=Fusobacterium TaxID=848 RepID=UPI001477574B|nr:MULTISPECIES: D-aminoacyl-tRNA deacylase [Fusobacterium]NME35238.1 D-tyrosyl-tRNA(Tyr) deacylase [Fusobacterium sp. FSA-380-WT-3A]